MNKIYKVVWSKVKNCYVVVSELAKNVITGSVKSAKVGAMPVAKGMAMGALMAFVITGNAWAADQTVDGNLTVNGSITASSINGVQIQQGSEGTFVDTSSIVIGKDASAVVVNRELETSLTYRKEWQDPVYLFGNLISEGKYVDRVDGLVISEKPSEYVYTNAVVIGNSANANGAEAVAIGNAAKAESNYSVAIGSGANTTKVTQESFTLGELTPDLMKTALAAANISVDYNAVHTIDKVEDTYSVALGYNTNATGVKSVAIGNQAVADDNGAVAIGNITDAATNSVAIGNEAKATGLHSLALGYKATASGQAGFALGTEAQATELTAVAIGNLAKANHSGSIAIGAGSQTTEVNSVAFGNRKLQQVAGGSVAEGSTDAVNGGQLWSVNNTLAQADATNLQAAKVYSDDNLATAKQYADGLKTTIETNYAAADATNLQTARDYADGLKSTIDIELEDINRRLALAPTDENFDKLVDKTQNISESTEAGHTIISGKVTINADSDDRVVIDATGITVGLNSTKMDDDGVYAGGHTYEEAAAAISADGKIKAAGGLFNVYANGVMEAQDAYFAGGAVRINSAVGGYGAALRVGGTDNNANAAIYEDGTITTVGKVVAGGNIETAAQVVATGGVVSGGNLNVGAGFAVDAASGNVVATGTVAAGNVVSSGDVFAGEVSLQKTAEELTKKANAADVYTKEAADAKFADKTYVDSTFAKADEVYTKEVADAKFADKTYVDSTFAKADDVVKKLDNVYTKEAADEKFAEKATTLEGYGITDAYTKEAADEKFAEKATTLEGYGIEDAYTKDQVDEKIEGFNQRLGKMNGKINKVGAGAAALAALHPLEYDPDDKLTFSAGVGNYAGENAAALGAFYRPDEKFMVSLGGTMGNGENMVNLGVSIGLDGAKGAPKLSKKELVEKVSTMAAENKAIKAENEALENRIEKLEALVAELAGKK